MVGRKFTRYGSDGSMSRLDRFLLSNDWLNKWRNLVQIGLNLSVQTTVLFYSSHKCKIGLQNPLGFLIVGLVTKNSNPLFLKNGVSQNYWLGRLHTQGEVQGTEIRVEDLEQTEFW